MRRVTIFDNNYKTVAFLSKDRPDIARIIIVGENVSADIRRQLEDIFDKTDAREGEDNFSAILKVLMKKGFKAKDSYTGETIPPLSG